MLLQFLPYLLLLGIPILASDFSADFIGDLEHYSIAYNIYSDGIKEHLDKLIQETPERIVTMKTSDQQDYKCILPAVEHKTHRKIEEYRGPSPLDLLKPLIDEREISIYGGSGYWFYDIAHGRFVRQYHENRDTKETTEYLLGTYRHDQTLEDAKKFDQLHPPKTKINNIEYPYFPVHYRHGTPCDLTGKPRTVTLLYICYEYSKHMVHSITEVSTCNYEISVLTNLLCSHPAFDMPTNPEHEIRCYAPPNHPHAKPTNLRALEEKAFSEHFDQYSMASDVSAAPHKSSVFSKLINPDGLIFPQRTGDNVAAGNLDLDQQLDDNSGRTVSDQLKEIANIYKKLHGSSSSGSKSKNKMAKFQKGFTDEDFQLIEDFWAGKSCFIGGQGYWSYEFCYGSKVSQFHLEGGKRTKEHTLGEFDAEVHRSWLRRNREKAFDYKDNYLQQVSNFYGNGVLCEESGEKRSVEVQLRCRMPAQTESPSIVLFSLEEPETCKYVLTLESALLCDGLQNLDKDGLIDPNAEEEFTTEIITDEEAIRKIIENIKSTKQYLEKLGGGIIIKEITEDVEEMFKSNKKYKKENSEEEEATDAADVDKKKKAKN